jgi:MinD-like ATPase involved in chromosome partitioning or flagellar assembly
MGGIEVNDVQNGLRKEVVSLIPSAGKEVVSALNKGTPFMLAEQNPDLSKAFYKLAELVAPPGQAGGPQGQQGAGGGGGVFGRLFGGK